LLIPALFNPHTVVSYQETSTIQRNSRLKKEVFFSVTAAVKKWCSHLTKMHDVSLSQGSPFPHTER